MVHEELVNIELITALRFRSVDSCGATGRRISDKRSRSIIDTRLKVEADQVCVLITVTKSVVGRNF